MLCLLRHGEAEANAPTDAQRRLTPRGEHQVCAAAEHLHGVGLTRILVSPYVRAQQTAALVQRQLGFTGVLQTVAWLTPDSSPLQALNELDAYEGESLLLVTHQPLVGALGGLLVFGSRQQALSMQTASLALLGGASWAAGAMHLDALVHTAA